MNDVGQAQYATSGSLLLAALDRVAGWLEPGDFRDPLSREVFGVLLAMPDRSAVIDPVTVLGELRRRGRLAGDGAAAMALIRMVKGPSHARSRGRLRPVSAGGLGRSAGSPLDHLPVASSCGKCLTRRPTRVSAFTSHRAGRRKSWFC
jgi:hypothetical protein